MPHRSRLPWLLLLLGAVACRSRAHRASREARAETSTTAADTPVPSSPTERGSDTLPDAPDVELAGWARARKVVPPAKAPRFIAVWATWCHGCAAETGFLSALAKKYEGKVDVFALTDEDKGAVKTFESKLKAPITLTFPIAIDRDSTTQAPLFKKTGVVAHMPYSFLLHGGKIVWHGAPTDATAALDEVLATGDAARARTASRELATLEHAYRKSLAADGPMKARVRGKRFLAAARGHATALNSVAWDVVSDDDGGDPVFGLDLARAAAEASQETDYPILDTLGLALWKNGKKAEALTIQRKAIALCDALGGRCPEEKRRLQQFEQQR